MASSLEDKLNLILEEKTTKIIPENIKKDVQIFDVVGTYDMGTDTSDATATANDIVKDKTAYVNGEKITGTIETQDSYESAGIIEADDTMQQLMFGMYSDCDSDNSRQKLLVALPGLNVGFRGEYVTIANKVGLTADKIVQGNTILGVEGTYENIMSQNDYDECLELTQQILGKDVSL